MANGRDGQRRYSDQDRALALAKLAENAGNVKLTARQLGIPEATLRSWANGVHHTEAAQNAVPVKSALADRWEKTAHAALDVVEREGGKLSPGAAATVAAIATDKMLLLRGEQPASAVVVIKLVSGDWVNDL